MFLVFAYITRLQKNARVAQWEELYSHRAEKLLNRAELSERQGYRSGE